mmetsp:Transcript_15515/g.31391  ORF Transcript_15515/g.31391 Transcript_15515/m.31391 type:complete len:173 (+) Transcript_15515:396-914(+)
MWGGPSWLMMVLIGVEAWTVLVRLGGGRRGELVMTCLSNWLGREGSRMSANGWIGNGGGLWERCMQVRGGLTKAAVTWKFWKIWTSYWVLLVLAPIFVAVFLNLDSAEWNPLTFALARCALFLGFASVDNGQLAVFRYICFDISWAVNVVIALECFARQRFRKNGAIGKKNT